MEKLSKNHWVFTSPVAHRGLADTEGFVENTLPAFINSAVKGYPIETDIRLNADGEIVCFHDDNLKRLAGRDDKIQDLTSQQLREVVLEKGQRICFFDEFLDHINGKVPLVIELKDHQDKILVKKAVERLSSYNGEFVFISFDPRLLYEAKKLAPQVLRGQLIVGSQKHPRLDKVKWAFINLRAKPHFVDHFIGNLHTPYKYTLCWTIRNKEDFEKAKRLGVNITFEDEKIFTK